MSRLAAAAALAITSPVLLAAMLAIRLESAGSPIYRQRRVGKDARPFDLFKLRTMVDGAGALYWVTLALQLALLAAALAAGALRWRPLLIARYYVLTTASPAAGLWDWLRHGTAPWWDAAEGTR